MASVNKVILLGTLGRDPEVRTTKSGDKIASMSIATERMTRTADGQSGKETEWHRIVIFKKGAEIAERFLKKGCRCHVIGHLRTQKYTDKNGVEKYTTEIICDELTLLDFADKTTGAPVPQREPHRNDEEVPF